jgi:hypothetical protein
MYREAANRPSGDRRQLRTSVGGSGPHGRNRDSIPMESDIAFTTFLPGTEFEGNEVPDGWAMERDP